VVGLLTSHCHLKNTFSSLYWRITQLVKGAYKRKGSSHTHPVSLWGHSLFKISSLGSDFMEPSDFYDAPIIRVAVRRSVFMAHPLYTLHYSTFPVNGCSGLVGIVGSTDSIRVLHTGQLNVSIK
jgi:hypothetical protein